MIEVASARWLASTSRSIAAHETMGDVSLRWVFVHMIEETARHAGHLDILCEQLADRRLR